MTMLVWAGQAIPGGTEGSIRNFAVAIEGNRIVEAGDKSDLMTRYPQAEVFGSDRWLMTAGMINSHDHGRALGTTPVGIPDDLLEIWITQLRTHPKIDPYVTAAYVGTRLLQSGVTTTVHLHNPGDWKQVTEESIATLKGYQDAGIRVAYCVQFKDQNQLVYSDQEDFFASLPTDLQEFAKPYLGSAPLPCQEYLAFTDDLIQRFHNNETYTTQISVCPAGGQWCSDDLILALVDFAKQKNIRVQMHLLETRYQKLYAERRWNKSFVKHLEEIGALGPWLTVAHLVWADPDDLPILATHQVGVVHNPSSNLRLRSGIAPLERMIKAGIAVGIGLDGEALDNDQDYLRELRLASVLGNKPGASTPSISPQNIWSSGTTLGAAVTFGAGPKIGKLEPGSIADLVLVDFDAVRGVWMSPDVEPLAILLSQGTRQHVRHVMVNGKWVIQDGRSLSVNEEDLISTIQQQLETQIDSSSHRFWSTGIKRLAPYFRQYYQKWDAENGNASSEA